MNRALMGSTVALAAFAGVLVLGAGSAVAEDKPCQMYIENGQYAPCPPPVISTGPGDDSPDSTPGVERSRPQDYEYPWHYYRPYPYWYEWEFHDYRY
ncbi:MULTISPECIES: hypothetical protein [Gordonia]|uniref:Secreted protein n=2 Tax=Gordonia amicalis TaxID=89053 RepID=A0AAE4R3Q6_9ACTN|nr:MULTISPECIES: hypothetical protein [Gordonia]ATD70545.1 hypothetical protein CNO18_09920 [Gordonia sp. 1D]MCR8895681.1 hypothetical protein [Gordonia sp. GONU]MCZ0913583.1 hypothetical protein [Gordonia amicalis]MCZ4577537.1 hypothetical protein [Gordonia amicalis]MCZ4651166.1 hypothetical protein [Gordonia amicalis]